MTKLPRHEEFNGGLGTGLLAAKFMKDRVAAASQATFQIDELKFTFVECGPHEPKLEICGDEQEAMSAELAELAEGFALLVPASTASSSSGGTSLDFKSLKLSINGVPIVGIKSLSFHQVGFEKDSNKDRGPT